ncbi:MAG TPA: DUF6624 domain-containing protein [Thermoanaerobaculia bacterium]|nr:DUF6624 domain-containing protein [Thermoanaerobaculia bacterium]
MKKWLAISLAVVAGCATAPPAPPPHADCAAVKQPQLCTELLQLRDRDQEVRRRWIANRADPALQQEAETVDRENVIRVREIIAARGWPGKSTVGEKGSAAAWTIIQHADAATLAQYIDVMQGAVDAGELHGSLFATSVDRMRVQEKRPQVYGTQFREVDGKMVPFPIEDEANVDALRTKVGLQPLAEYAALMNQMYMQQKKP